MKITGLRSQPVGRIAAMLYGTVGVLFWVASFFTGAERMIIPIGFIAPLLHLNFNLNLPSSSSTLKIPYSVFLMLCSAVAYAASGWITATIAVICFNAVAKARGGIDADFICLESREEQRIESQVVE